MKSHSNILEVDDFQPDYMGFIFYKPSPRYVGDDFEIPRGLNASVNRVGVFVNEPVDRIINLCKKHGLSHVQLHGDEPVEICEQVKASGLSVIKAFGINEDFDFSIVQPYKNATDYFLFDTKGKYYGGNATAFDWTVLEKYDQETPFLLSGGLSIQNITDVSRLENMNIHALDLNSGVETEPGIKDLQKVEQAIELVHKLNNV
ncbi:MAG: phosphoribosylanthranilate isomerase [Cyclobacteriaceae bacterium]|nr:phosphoribosylanthranilate isomerase [Cyclobacteriaceae bacterium]